MATATFSALDRLAVCVGSAVLPHVQRETGEATRGTVIHAYLERAVGATDEERAAALKDVEDADHFAACEAIDLSRIPAGAEREVALALDLATGRAERLTLTSRRSYPDDGRICGTLDLVGRIGSVAYCGDYKTGEAPRAGHSLQIGAGCLAAARLIGADEAVGEVLALRHDGKWFIDRAEFDAFDLLAVEDELRQIDASIRRARSVTERGGLPVLTTGGHCTYCPSRVYCPAINALVRQVSQVEIATIAERVAAMTDAEAGAFYLAAKQVEKIAGAALDALKARAADAPLPLGGGKELRRGEMTIWRKDPRAAAELDALTAEFKAAGLIYPVKTDTTRVVNSPDAPKRRTRKAAAAADNQAHGADESAA